MKKDRINQYDEIQHNNDDDLNDEITCIEEILKNYVVPVPNEDAIGLTIEQLRQYVPQKKKLYMTQWEKFMNLIHLSALDINFMSKSYWIISSIIFVLGYIIVTSAKHNPYISIMALSPFPFVLGIVEVFKGREQNVVEIELSCKITPQQIMLSKLIVIGFYNIILNTVLTLIFDSLYPEVILWKITLMWLTPLTVIGGITLWLANRIRGGYTVTVILGLWMSVILAIYTQPEVATKVMNINIAFYIAALIIGIVLTSVQIKNILNRYYFERSEIYESNY
ncbi:hypothetical protein SAMN02746089_02587 [Caldanaerobius fijiensis DSM 17918]|uniref:ABC-2 family transporter protein n=1 Tax=Caldanaerobius fijiensis DSM 17918 TaxID=1121256 RepID=A0A1M5ENS9_9THEO|nr:hypothetical protein [Caldanaerobius fijiensis]SHF80948.1 hypothetical protein SAMN02746089_02587 [Caldanaerobius fijiensis DSM 17918]